MPFEKGMSGNPDGQGKESEYVVAGNKTQLSPKPSTSNLCRVILQIYGLVSLVQIRKELGTAIFRFYLVLC